MTFVQDLSITSSESFGIVTRYFIDTPISTAAELMLTTAKQVPIVN